MKAIEVFSQNNGDVTKAYYAELNSRGPFGEIATALFRAQKRSSRAKDYKRGKFRRAAYDVKSWSISEVCRLLTDYRDTVGITFGWKQDPRVLFGEKASWVLYVDLPQGQVSFHSPDRGNGPDYKGNWCGEHRSAERIIMFCDSIMNGMRPSQHQSIIAAPQESLPVHDDDVPPWEDRNKLTFPIAK